MIKIIFNLDDDEISSDELKELLGYSDADFSFKNMFSEILTSTNEVKKLIGVDAYNSIFEAYDELKDTDGKFELDLEDIKSVIVRATRLAIVRRAYMLYAPSNDVSHTNDGRTQRSGESNKTPWQWQIDNDNKNLEKNYYRALDDLIELLDNSKPEDYTQLNDEDKKKTIWYLWTNSAAYKKLKKCFVNSIDDFNDVFIIESSYLLFKLVSAIDECERREILSRIGKEKFALLKSGQNLEEIDLELIRLIKIASVFYAMAWGISRLSVTLFPEGVLQFQVSDRSNTQAKKPAIGNEHQLAMDAFKISSINALRDIELLLAPIPEPTTETQSILRPVSSCDKGFSAT